MSMEEHYESELARSASVLSSVDRSLERLSEGSYGSCEVCGAPLSEAHLESDPTRSLCPQHLAPAPERA